MKRPFCYSLFVLTVTFASLFSSCDSLFSGKEQYQPTFSVDSSTRKVLVLQVPNRPYYDLFVPFVHYMNEHLGNVRVQMIAGNSYEDHLQKLNRKEFDFTIVNGRVALELEHQGCTIVGKVENDDQYRGVILVNKDSAINDFSDLVGKTISTPGKDALAGHMMPMYFLHQNGINIRKDIRIMDVGSFESAILNAYHGECSAAFGWLSNWETFIKRRPEIANRIEVKWTTPSTVNVALVFSNDMDTRIQEQIKELVFTMHNTEQGRKILELLGTDKVVPANSSSYEPLKKFLEEYNSIDQ